MWALKKGPIVLEFFALVLRWLQDFLPLEIRLNAGDAIPPFSQAWLRPLSCCCSWNQRATSPLVTSEGSSSHSPVFPREALSDLKRWLIPTKWFLPVGVCLAALLPSDWRELRNPMRILRPTDIGSSKRPTGWRCLHGSLSGIGPQQWNEPR